MEQTYRIALWQGPSPEGDAEAAFATLDQALRAASAMGAKALVAPELYLPGYNQDNLATLAQERGGVWHARLSSMAKATGCAVVVGYAEREGTRMFNAAVAIGPQGQELAHYRKVQLYGPREQALFTPGEAYATFDLGGVKAALLICYDIEFAHHIAALAAKGVELILCPTANMAPFTHVAKATVPAMAANNGLTIVYANYCGTEGDLDYVGLSLIADPYGEALAQAGTGPALLVADVPLNFDATRLSTQARDLKVI
jgi:nitrilase